jgi:hypothetical protein
VLEWRPVRRRGRVVEGTPLLREHAAYTRIEGSNPSVSASNRFFTVPNDCRSTVECIKTRMLFSMAGFFASISILVDTLTAANHLVVGD